jgi:transcriptional regulator with XRE-family HTH domain
MGFSPARLRAARERAVLSQLDLAKRSGVSRQAISKLEGVDPSPPYPSTVRKLARALGIKPQELMED